MNIKQLRLPPSSFPSVAKCPCWERMPFTQNKYTIRGSELDTLLRDCLRSPDAPVRDLLAPESKLTSTDTDGVEWVKKSILSRCGDNPVLSAKTDCRFKFEMEGVLISGEMDACCPGKVSAFDLKSGGVYDYKHQMLAYALHMMTWAKADKADIYLAFCDHKLIKHRVISYEEAYATTSMLVMMWLDPNKKPVKSNACYNCNNKDAEGNCKLLAR